MGKAGRSVLRGLGIIAIVVWLLYFPVLYGIEIPEKYMQALRLFPQDWLF